MANCALCSEEFDQKNKYHIFCSNKCNDEYREHQTELDLYPEVEKVKPRWVCDTSKEAQEKMDAHLNAKEGEVVPMSDVLGMIQHGDIKGLSQMIIKEVKH
jgi:hypothetical protein